MICEIGTMNLNARMHIFVWQEFSLAVVQTLVWQCQRINGRAKLKRCYPSIEH